MAFAATPFNVRVEKRPEASFGETIGEIRCWLDRHKYLPVSLNPVATRENGVGFEVSFNSEIEADSFQREFTPLCARRPCETAGLYGSPISDRLRAIARELEARAQDLERARLETERPMGPAEEIAALHELSESTFASSNYLAAANHLLEASSGPDEESLRKVLQKAFLQSARVSQAVHRLRLFVSREGEGRI